MKSPNIFNYLEKVSAPPEFESNLMKKLSLYKKRRKRIKYLRLSFATAAIILFIIVGSVYFLEFKKKNGEELQSLYNNPITVIEKIDYTQEYPISSQNKETIFILEQVSNNEEIYF